MSAVRVGIDIGGTFTDLVLHGRGSGLEIFKSPTTPGEFERGFIDVLRLAGKVSTVFNTHYHLESTGGNDAMAKAGAKIVAHMKNGDVALIENVRFHAEEERNDPEFAKKLASLGDIFVNDAFGAAAVMDYFSLIPNLLYDGNGEGGLRGP